MPSDAVDIENLRQALSDRQKIAANSFAVLQDLCSVASGDEVDEVAQELVLRALENRDAFGSGATVLDGLVRSAGLFPYLEPDELSVADRIAFEVHRPANLDSDVVFHAPQAEVYWSLMDGENVILSAPTSFGKSLIIDGAIASGKYNNILVVVPTIALIDETRRRLSRRFAGKYKIITHPFQSTAQRNVFVLTQERVQELGNIDVDLFVIDEFYKLSPEREDDERCARLNEVFYRLLKSGRQFYMLGPSVEGLNEALRGRFEYRPFIERYHTVVTELHDASGPGDEMERLVALCKELRDPTLIFCSSPPRATEVARVLLRAGIGAATEEARLAAAWTAETYHPEWHVSGALAQGIGVHHGRVPRALAQYLVSAFDRDVIRFLVCTSTLIEGVNTKAKNVVIFDDKINRSRIDFFTFNNIRGRSGRMGKHFIGHVYLFHPPPEEDLPFVDIPALSQPEGTPDSLLIQIDQEDLSARSAERLERYSNQEVLSYATLKANVGIDPMAQLNAAREIVSDIRNWSKLLSWTALPTSPQLAAICRLIWTYFGGAGLGSGSARSWEQLTFLINRLRSAPSTAELIAETNAYRQDPDLSVQLVLDFLRLWANFHFPRLLRAIDRIQGDVLSRRGYTPGKFDFFASQVENCFTDPALAALDDYGIPIEVARKLAGSLSGGDLDTVLERLKRLPLDMSPLSRFEKILVAEAQSSL